MPRHDNVTPVVQSVGFRAAKCLALSRQSDDHHVSGRCCLFGVTAVSTKAFAVPPTPVVDPGVLHATGSDSTTTRCLRWIRLPFSGREMARGWGNVTDEQDCVLLLRGPAPSFQACGQRVVVVPCTLRGSGCSHRHRHCWSRGLAVGHFAVSVPWEMQTTSHWSDLFTPPSF